jgi:hypothetical protein
MIKTMTTDDFDPLQDAHGPAERKKPPIKIIVPFDFWERIKAWKNRRKRSRNYSSPTGDSSLPSGSDVI